ncbi:MAG: hypothetical protein K2P88_01855 [Chitinophagaceae bacterium]|nr:hypothetical protein [Chitinophagaceae bacterium]
MRLLFIFFCLLGMLVKGSAQSKPELSSFTDTFGIYSIKFPKTYFVSKQRPQTTMFVAPKDNDQDKFQERIVIEVASVDANVTIESIEKAIVEQLLANLKGSTATLKYTTKLDGIPTKKQIFSWTSSDGVMLTAAHYWLISKGTLIRITTLEETVVAMQKKLNSGKSFSEMKTPEEEIVESIVVLKK